MKKWLSLLTALLLLQTGTAYAAKARSIKDDPDSLYHATHLRRHIGETTCRATGNYLKTRKENNRKKVIGHLEQADVFELLDIEDGYALIRVITAHKTSPDSRPGMTGWVNSDYIDCPCSEEAYLTPPGGKPETLPPAEPESIAPVVPTISATVDKLRVREKPNGKVLDRIGKADELALLALQDEWVQIIVTGAADEEDLRIGLTGWVKKEFIHFDENMKSLPTTADPYAPIRALYYRMVAEKWSEMRIYDMEVEGYDFPQDPAKGGFVYRDINTDGIPEMFIINDPEAGWLPFLAGYTLENGIPKRIFGSWARCRYYVCGDGSILIQGSNGAAYTVNYICDFDGTGLKIREGVLSGDYVENGETKYGWFLCDEMADTTYEEHTLITDEEALAWMERWESAVVTFQDVIPFADYLTAVPPLSGEANQTADPTAP